MTQLSNLHETALAAVNVAYLAHDVAGSDKRLCYQGRINRGVRMQAEAHAAGDTERIKRIQVSLDKISAEYRDKEVAARMAVARYHSAGGTAQISVTCQCEECLALVEPTVRYIKLTVEDCVAPPPAWRQSKYDRGQERAAIRAVGKSAAALVRARREGALG
ncbi:MAG: hypothetical protein ACOYD4_11670 [Solirubrobacterales bacterium]